MKKIFIIIAFMFLFVPSVWAGITNLGDVPEDSTVYLPFNTNDGDGASCTITNLVNTDVHVHKDGGLTQRNNAAGVTVSVDFDGITGNHLIAIDTSDDTVAGFWVTGSDYLVRIEGTTIDTQTVNAWIGMFSIQNRYPSPTNIVDNFETQSQADPTGFHVNVKEVNGTAQTANDNGADINAILEDTATIDTQTKLRTLLTGSDTAVSTITTAQVNTEVVDVIRTDTIPELTAGAPAAEPTLANAVMLPYMALRNKRTVSTTSSIIYDDDGAAICAAAVETDGTTTTKAEFGAAE